jgi:pectinesterase
MRSARYMILLGFALLSTFVRAQDPVADNMLLYQRAAGGWPKHIDEVKVDYTKPLSEAARAGLVDDKGRNDATIDNNATSKEIRYLLKAYEQTGNKNYLAAAEKGVRYLLRMQYANGGFPQFWPDTSGYRKAITYNDNAMINALNILRDVAERRNGFEAMEVQLAPLAKKAVDKGIDCILKTQVRRNGKLTAWCAQHDCVSYAPVKARSFELVSLSGNESVGITQFLMRTPHPTEAIRTAVNSAIEWFRAVRIDGYAYGDTLNASFEKGHDRLLHADRSSTVWARFYDIDTDKPFFSGRDGVKRWKVEEIEYERRNGYAWYGTWPAATLEKEYPHWAATGGPDKGVLTVALMGKADFRSIQDALNSLPDSSESARTIRIAGGTYHEKLMITKHNIVFRGAGRDKTIITQDIARDEWRCDHADDWGVATVNINANDISFENLTVANEYGFHFAEPREVACKADTTKGTRRITKDGHQMALRSLKGTRIKATNCRFRAWAGDTVSPWNLEDGMFYFKDCVMEGGVDFYCPRGWAWAENCSFYANTGSAAIWHDGSGNPSFRTVLKNCSFDGFDGFKLGRYHKDARFYLVGCRFSERMADTTIYQVKTTNTLQWGRRVYFADCHRSGGDYAWFADNLSSDGQGTRIEDVTPAWLFGQRWTPQKTRIN